MPVPAWMMNKQNRYYQTFYCIQKNSHVRCCTCINHISKSCTKITFTKNGSSCSIENQPCKNLSKFSSSKNSKLHKKNLREKLDSFVSSEQSNVVNCVHSQSLDIKCSLDSSLNANCCNSFQYECMHLQNSSPCTCFCATVMCFENQSLDLNNSTTCTKCF